MEKDVYLNDFAIRSFRDVADYDYLSARMAYRAKLFPQFLWSGQQAIEKYLKCILLLNRIPARKVRHNLSAALDLLRKQLPFELRLQEPSTKLIQHLDTYGRFRYFEVPFHIKGFEIAHLDMAVWEIRRYCAVLDYSITLPNDAKQHMLKLKLKKIEDSESHPPQKFRIHGGALEKILADRKNPARQALIWQNLFFGTQNRKRVKLQWHMYAANSPLALHPEILDDVLRYVYFPGKVAEEYRAELTKRTRK